MFLMNAQQFYEFEKRIRFKTKCFEMFFLSVTKIWINLLVL